MHLNKELQTFARNKARLLIEKKGRFVLIKNEKVISDFENYDEALTDGYRKFGNTEFLIKQVVENEVANFFSKEVFG